MGLGPPFFVGKQPETKKRFKFLTMSMEKTIAHLIEPALEDMGFGLVRVRIQGTDRMTVQIMADRLDEAPINVEDCADISRAISAILDVEDPISQAYSLEVSSPGIDRPLTRLRDFVRFEGHEAKIELVELIDGRRRFRGILSGVEDEEVRIETDTGLYGIPFGVIGAAKLVLTDALIAASQAAAAEYEGATAEGASV